MKKYLTKDLIGQPLDIDQKTRSVKFAFASIGDMDRDRDVFEESAFTKSIRERGPNGTNEIWHLLDHTPKLSSSLSKMREIYVENRKLIGVSDYRDTFSWREVAWPLYEKGDITQHSIGFQINDYEYFKDQNLTVIKDVTVWEGSAVLWGANPNTPTLEVAKSLGIYTEKDEPGKRIEQMIKALKSDKWDEDAKSLFIIELKQIQSELISTVPDEKTILPQKVNKLNESLILAYLSL